MWPTIRAALLAFASAWFFFVPPEHVWPPRQEGYAASIAIYAASAGALILLARAANGAWRRQLESSAEAALRALSAFARSEDRTRALRAGFQAHLAKPVDPTELVATVASFAAIAAATRGGAPPAASPN